MELDTKKDDAKSDTKLDAWNLSASDMSFPSSCSASISPVAAERGLRRVKDDIPLRLWIAASITLWEKAAFWGCTAPFQNYMQHPPRKTHEDTPGALGLGQVKATRIYCAFYIAYYISPMAFAILSDSHLGRYRTLVVCLILFNIGCAAITFSSLPGSLDAGFGLPGLIIAMVFMALGGGGFESNMAAFLADQYTETEPRVKTLRSGEEVITDRSLTIEYLYSLNYWLGNVGSLSCFAVVALERNMSFTAAYGLTFGFVFVALLTLVIGQNYFVRMPHESKIFAQASQILLCASMNGFRLSRADPAYQLEHRRKIVPWSSTLVDELRRGLQGCQVLLAFIVFYVCFDQMQNNLISQSAQMETGGTPNDMIAAMNQVGCILFTPLIQHIIYPLLHKRHIYLGPITRIVIGFGFVTSSMAYAAIVQNIIYSSSPCYDRPRACSLAANREPNHANVWIQAPVFFLIAMGEVWAYVTALEIAYSHAPKNMKSIIQAMFPLMAGFGSASAMVLTPIAHDPNLVIFYASLAGAMAVTTIIFWFVFRNKDTMDHEDEIDEVGSMTETPFSANSRASVATPRSGHADIELDPMSVPPTNSAFGSSVLLIKPDAAKHTADQREILTEVPCPAQSLPAMSRSPSTGTRKLQKRQPQFSFVAAEPHHPGHIIASSGNA